jgi:hypothetical protein
MFRPLKPLHVCVATCLAAALLHSVHAAAQASPASNELAQPAPAYDYSSLADLSLKELLSVKIAVAPKQEEKAKPLRRR